MNTPPSQLPGPADPKPAIQSVGVIGGTTSLVAIITAVIAAKTHLPPDQVSTVVTPLVVGAAGSIAAIWGRLRAKQPIKGVVTTGDTSPKA